MKVFVIVLALIAASFAAVVVYGVARDRPAASAGGAPDPDALEDWEPPRAVSALEGVKRRFGPGVEIERPDVSLPGGLGVERRTVPPADSGLRVANLRLVSGPAARVTVSQVGEDDKSVCLCRPDAPLGPDDLKSCKPRWVARWTDSDGCKEGAEENGLPLTRGPATLSFVSARPAEVRVR